MNGPADESYLGRNPANYVPLTPLSFLARSAEVFPQRIAVVYEQERYTWQQFYARCRRLASALAGRGIRRGDTVAVLAPNVPAILEAHFAVPMVGAVLNTINIRLEAGTIAYILEHGEAKLSITDAQYSPEVAKALKSLANPPPVIDIVDPHVGGGERLGQETYEEFLMRGDPAFAWSPPADEWQSMSLNYTSGTTAKPKGVVYSHRAVYLNALGNAFTAEMSRHPVYLWALPMFHANGWCFPFTVTALAGTHICMRKVEAGPMFNAIAAHRVTHFCGAPVVLNMLINSEQSERRPLPNPVTVVTAGSAPPPTVLAAMERMGFNVVHAYGLTETLGAVVLSQWHEEWDSLPADERARLKARQGVRTIVHEGTLVADSKTLVPVARDGQAVGEIMMRGNVTMKGYFKDPQATAAAFAGGWLHSGDLGTMHADGYLEVTDRAKDIVISGAENISSLEVESVLFSHPAVLEAAVVARPDEKWGETVCAFVTLKPNARATAAELVAFCRQRLAGFKVPRTVVFSELPKTATGKVQKFLLRERARQLNGDSGG